MKIYSIEVLQNKMRYNRFLKLYNQSLSEVCIYFLQNLCTQIRAKYHHKATAIRQLPTEVVIFHVSTIWTGFGTTTVDLDFSM